MSSSNYNRKRDMQRGKTQTQVSRWRRELGRLDRDAKQARDILLQAEQRIPGMAPDELLKLGIGIVRLCSELASAASKVDEIETFEALSREVEYCDTLLALIDETMPRRGEDTANGGIDLQGLDGWLRGFDSNSD